MAVFIGECTSVMPWLPAFTNDYVGLQDRHCNENAERLMDVRLEYVINVISMEY
jgi:hypothetical protein